MEIQLESGGTHGKLRVSAGKDFVNCVVLELFVDFLLLKLYRSGLNEIEG